MSEQSHLLLDLESLMEQNLSKKNSALGSTLMSTFWGAQAYLRILQTLSTMPLGTSNRVIVASLVEVGLQKYTFLNLVSMTISSEVSNSMGTQSIYFPLTRKCRLKYMYLKQLWTSLKVLGKSWSKMSVNSGSSRFRRSLPIPSFLICIYVSSFEERSWYLQNLSGSYFRNLASALSKLLTDFGSEVVYSFVCVTCSRLAFILLIQGQYSDVMSSLTLERNQEFTLSRRGNSSSASLQGLIFLNRQSSKLWSLFVELFLAYTSQNRLDMERVFMGTMQSPGIIKRCLTGRGGSMRHQTCMPLSPFDFLIYLLLWVLELEGLLRLFPLAIIPSVLLIKLYPLTSSFVISGSKGQYLIVGQTSTHFVSLRAKGYGRNSEGLWISLLQNEIRIQTLLPRKDKLTDLANNSQTKPFIDKQAAHLSQMRHVNGLIGLFLLPHKVGWCKMKYASNKKLQRETTSYNSSCSQWSIDLSILQVSSMTD